MRGCFVPPLSLLLTFLCIQPVNGMYLFARLLRSGRNSISDHARGAKVIMMSTHAHASTTMSTSTLNVQAEYYTLRPVIQETLYVIKNSKFYTKTIWVNSVDEAVSFVNKNKDVKASHNCWAYRGLDYERSSDDGEPSGTAGRPILSALQEYDVKNCVVLVTRFFGGVKLGTGGLSRAYQAAAQQVLAESIRVPVFRTELITLSSHVDDFGILQQLVEYFNNKKVSVSNTSMVDTSNTLQTVPSAIERVAEDYDLDVGTVALTVRVLSGLTSEIATMLTDVTKGRGSLKIITTS